ncbi:pyrimidine-nucleoside phosphorylase [Thermotoga sp. KOL6]|uniref:pyrimidine-nucleoside phosphorylase n=1 Tax=Thermotoga sp. KOL6 TaxID=126741 RepID=UPI000C7908B3|nr:pyrimidine-nucleoside phosphorylase [Thermotoga sp. KOL6]PLV60500.1 thymidine phosphorylase [Thermotoga sp. KOL6]
MRAYDIILKKRNGGKLSKEEINFMVHGYVRGEVADYQMAAFLMAVFFRHMDEEETYYLTESMMRSGEILDLSEIPGVKVDKHSTGGVGDKTTLVVAPLVASCGIPVAKMSGRALGHTGGTIDKLESIPGFKAELPLDKFIENVKKYGIAIVSQTGNLVPADKKIYALRDATATVDEMSLIASSIMSKKLAAGSDAFVLDVKFGTGAFVKDKEESRRLAKLMLEIAKKHDKKAAAVLSNMNQPLGKYVGNSLEVIEAIETLKGNGPKDLVELSITLGALMLDLAGVFSFEEGKEVLRKKIENGEALEKFRILVKAQGGDEKIVDAPWETLPVSERVEEFKADKEGYVSWIDTEKVGTASMLLGAGRKRKEDRIDHSVGIVIEKKLGDFVRKGETVAKVFFSEKSDLEAAMNLLREAYFISDTSPGPFKVVEEVIK